MSRIKRRTFMKGAAGVAAGAVLGPAFNVMGANEELRVAVIGIKGRGANHIDGLGSRKGVKITALCDCDSKVLAGSLAKYGKKWTHKISGHQDLREVMDSKDIDIVSTATPNHWHALITIWACQAGKDVYVEKPVCHNVFEGQQMVKAARKYNRIVQTGTQSRSNGGMRDLMKYIHDGKLGKVLVSRGFCYKPRASIGKVSGPTPIPANIDYNLWCGPAPMGPLMRQNLHYDWHWVWETGNGDLGNQGIHQMDLARWALNVNHLSPRVISVGGRLGYDDDGTTPNTQVIYHDYAPAPLIFEVRGLPKAKEFQNKDWGKSMPTYRGVQVGNVIECEGGDMIMTSYSGGKAVDKKGKEIQNFVGGGDHFQNFIDAVRSRKITDLNADIQEGYLSSALCHTGNISHQVGKTAEADEIKGSLQSSKMAAEAFDRFAEHLNANGVDIKGKVATLGPMLTMDTKTEKFEGNEKANALLTRAYREPFVVKKEI